MQLMAWSDYEISYDLNNDFSIRKAESEEWGLYCSIYYNMQYNGFFKEERFNSAQRNAFGSIKASLK